jgi:hypothetical protein
MPPTERAATYNRVLQYATLAAILAAIAVNTFYNFFPISGLNVGQISNQILAGVLITPANYAFAIWGLIYLGLLTFGGYQLLPNQRDNPRLGYARTGVFWASFFQILWIFAFQYRQFWLSVAYILAILTFLTTAYLGLRLGQGRCGRRERWFVRLPISVYFAWITVATIVNVASALFAAKWGGWGIAPTNWTIGLLLVATGIAIAIARRFEDTAFALVVVWALGAIAVKHWQVNEVSPWAIAFACGIVAVLVGGNRKFRRQLGL